MEKNTQKKKGQNISRRPLWLMMTFLVCFVYNVQSQISTISTSCSGTTTDLSTITTSNMPPNTELTWHTTTPVSNANRVANPTIAAVGSYYAAFYDTTGDCYSTASTQVNVVELVCVSTACSETTVDLTTITASNMPPSTELTWHTTTPVSNANRVADPAIAPVGSYYAAFYDTINDCYSTASTQVNVVQPICVSTACSETTVDLSTITASNMPSGTELTWHTTTPVSNANRVADPTMVSVGTYYAAFYDTINDCYSTASTQVNVVVPICVSNICPSETVDLSTITASNMPANTQLTWHTGIPATNANRVLDVTALNEGVYYASFYDSVDDCYANGGNAVQEIRVTTEVDCNTTNAENDINQTPEDTNVAGNVLTNDTDEQGDSQTVQSALADTDGDGLVDNNLPLSTPTTIYAEDSDNPGTYIPAGEITLNPDGSYIFDPEPGFTGEVPVEYTVVDDNGNPAMDNATLTIEVIGDPVPGNNPPVANDDTNSTEQDTQVNGNVLPNDSDLDGDPLTVTEALADTDGDGMVDDPLPTDGTPTPVYGTDEDGNTVPAGTIAINPDGSYTYTPDTDFTGEVLVDYTIEDPDGLTDDATLTITVEPLNTQNNTYANDDANIGFEDVNQTGNILGNDNDPEGNAQTVDSATDNASTPLTVDGVTANPLPSGGTLVLNPDGTYTYDPVPGFIGTEVVAYTVCDDGTPQACDTATLYLTTVMLNIPDVTPIISAVPNVMHGETNFYITVRVTELNLTNTNGLITVRVPKDTRWILDGPYDSGLTTLGVTPLNNSDWAYSDDGTSHIFTTTSVISAGGFSYFGFNAIWSAGATEGEFTITSQIDSFSGGEDRIDNNVDAEQLDYFIE